MARQVTKNTERCPWVDLGKPDYVAYHDLEWGVPVHDDKAIFEFLTLEGAQAGLSWYTVLRKRDAYRKAFAGFQVNAALMENAPEGAVFLHCLPARRGEEVTDEVIDGHYSAVLVQAANRMHVQKGLLAWLLHEVE